MTLALMLRSKTTSSFSMWSLNRQVMERRCPFCIQPCPAVHKKRLAHTSAVVAAPSLAITTICRTASVTQAKWHKLPFPRKLIQSLCVYSATPTSLPCATVTTLSSKSKPCGSKGLSNASAGKKKSQNKPNTPLNWESSFSLRCLCPFWLQSRCETRSPTTSTSHGELSASDPSQPQLTQITLY